MAFPNYILTLNPIAYYELNETSGTTAIDIANGNNGSINSNVTLNQPSIMNYNSPAYLFNANGGVNIVSIPGTGIVVTSTVDSYYTSQVMFWIKSNLTQTGTAELFNINGFECLITSSGGLEFYLQGHILLNGVAYPTNLLDGNTHSVIVSIWAAGNLNGLGQAYIQYIPLLWIDGVFYNLGPDAPAIYQAVTYYVGYKQILSACTIGTNIANTEGFKGRISNVAVFQPYYNQVLNAALINEAGGHFPLPTTYNYWNNEFIDAAIMNRHTGQPVNAALRVIPNELLNFLPPVETLRIDLWKYMQSIGDCSATLPPIYIYSNGTSSDTPSNNYIYQPDTNFFLGYYYRVPVSNLIVNGQVIPKYNNYFSNPYLSMLYPQYDIYGGYTLVKSTIPLSPLPADVTPLSESQIQAELIRIMNLIYAV